MRNADHLCCYEGGGLSANIRGDQVLVGSAAFMNLMDIPLPQGLNVKSAVFCAINGELAGIFALSYSLHDTIFPALEELMREKIGPVLATRDFGSAAGRLSHLCIRLFLPFPSESARFHAHLAVPGMVPVRVGPPLLMGPDLNE